MRQAWLLIFEATALNQKQKEAPTIFGESNYYYLQSDSKGRYLKSEFEGCFN